MEKHIFKFGASSLAIIVPKKWADKHGLGPSSAINVTEGNRGELVMSPEETRIRDVERGISRGLNPELLGRWVGLHYMYGTRKLRLYSKEGLTQAQLDSVERKLNDECIGFEVTSQSNTDLVIEDFTNIKEIDIGKVVSRIRFLIDQEFKEIEEGDPRTVGKIEKRVNRFYMLGIRYVNMIQPREYARYLGMLTMLELVSDNIDVLSTTPLVRSRGLVDTLHRQFGRCFAAFDGDERAIEEVAGLRAAAVSRIGRERADKLHRHLLMEITDSIAKISEYGFNAERQGVGTAAEGGGQG